MHPDVSTYYEKTAFDYRVVWGGSRSNAVHFGYYDEHARQHRAALDNLNRALAEFGGIQPGIRVLDAGCGRGSAAFWLAGHLDCEVVGINISTRQLADCQREKSRKGVSFLLADYTATPFPDASFDVVWACESLCHAPQKTAFYHEAYRLLRPGGRLVMAEYLRSARPLPPSQETLLAAWLRPWAIPDIDTVEEHRAHALAAGFAGFSEKNVTPQVWVSLRNLHGLCRKWLPWGRIMRFLGIVDGVRMGNLVASIRQFEALEEGAWRYGFLLAEK